MRIKTYIVEDIRSVSKVIQEDLGESAVVISSRKIDNGQYEVLAAAESTENRIPNFHAAERSYAEAVGRRQVMNIPEPENSSASFLENEPISKHHSKLNAKVREPFMPEVLKQAIYLLTSSGVESDIAMDFVKKYCHLGNTNEFPADLLYNAISRNVYTMDNVPDGVHYFFGYPGEGKSTLVMKIADYLREQGKQVVLLTIDQSKFAAGDDLKKFAEWSSFGFLRITELDDLNRLKRKGITCLIDTPGNLSFELLAKNIGKKDSVHLVIDPIRGLPGELWQSIHGRNDFISFTKLDYLKDPGKLLSIYLKIMRPISFMSNTPTAPGGLIVPTGDDIASEILGEKLDKNKGNKLTSWVKKLTHHGKSSLSQDPKAA